MDLMITIEDDHFKVEQRGDPLFDFSRYTGVDFVHDPHELVLYWSETGDSLHLGSVGGEFSSTFIDWAACLPTSISSQPGGVKTLDKVVPLAQSILRTLEQTGFEPKAEEGIATKLVIGTYAEIFDHFEREMSEEDISLARTYVLAPYYHKTLRVQISLVPVLNGHSTERDEASAYPVRMKLGMIDNNERFDAPDILEGFIAGKICGERLTGQVVTK